MKKLLIVVGLAVLILTTGCSAREEKTITAFVGSASKPPMDELALNFEKETGIKVYVNYGGSGTVLAQMKLARTGDLYIPGSPDYMAIAEREGVVDTQSVRKMAYLVPVIAVPKGNPKNIQTLADLARPGTKVSIANPETVCVGLYAVEILEYNRLLEPVAKNIVTLTESCEKTATLVALKSVDAVIGWDVFDDWNPDSIEVIHLKPEQLPRIAYIPAALSTFVKDETNSRKFLDFLVSTSAQQVFRKWGYITTEAEARQFAPGARIGGEYTLPERFKSLVR